MRSDERDYYYYYFHYHYYFHYYYYYYYYYSNLSKGGGIWIPTRLSFFGFAPRTDVHRHSSFYFVLLKHFAEP